jgi:hypothetical protein
VFNLRLDNPFAGLMETTMSKTNDTSKLGHAKFKNRRTLAEGELDAVTGGQKIVGVVKWPNLVLRQSSGKKEI